MAELVCDRLTLGYEGEALVKDLSFAVEKGNYLCIVGENGTGKSTLMRTLLHLQQPMAGTVTFGDGMKENEVGYLPQQTQVQRDFPASVREIVLSGCQARLGKRFFYNAEERKLAAENMERLGISSLAERCYRELSGGQQQRVNHEGITVIMVSHDVGATIRYASHILHIGDKVFFGTKEDYLKTPSGMQFLETAEEMEETKA